MVRPVSYGKLSAYVASALGWAKGEHGQTLFEVTMILALVALVAVLALTALGVAITGFFEPVAAAMGM
jgi:Flp pilus assembly pilin Flp